LGLTTSVSATSRLLMPEMTSLAAAVPDRPGMTAEQLADAKAEIERVRATLTERAVALHPHAETHPGTERRPGPGQGGR
jgi:hypothetical protein